MATHLDTAVSTSPYSIPLLDASSLPSEEDWALLESISGYSDSEPEADRLGRFRLTASLDE
jgi:hypothetical protein